MDGPWHGELITKLGIACQIHLGNSPRSTLQLILISIAVLNMTFGSGHSYAALSSCSNFLTHSCSPPVDSTPTRGAIGAKT